jgi:hypothetical protein
MRLGWPASFVLPWFLLSGCLSAERTETRITFANDDRTAVVEVTFTDLSSDEKTEKDALKDFERLLRNWKGEEYAVELAQEGLYVKERELGIKDGKIVGRLKGLAKSLDKMSLFVDRNGERFHFLGHNGSEELVRSNAKVVKTGKNTILYWPDDAQELSWITRSEPNRFIETNRKLFLKKLAALPK